MDHIVVSTASGNPVNLMLTWCTEMIHVRPKPPHTARLCQVDLGNGVAITVQLIPWMPRIPGSHSIPPCLLFRRLVSVAVLPLPLWYFFAGVILDI